MDAMQNRSFNSLVKRFLGICLPDRLSQEIAYRQLPREARQFALRMLSLMQRASYPAADFTPLLIRGLSTTAGSSLPGAWNGRIPPITMAGRHRKLDLYVAGQSWPQLKSRPLFLDLGCGFPPATTVDTAKKFRDWNVFGVDRKFAAYMLVDAKGHYACFDRDGSLLYMQARLTTSGITMNDDPQSARNRFQALFDQMRSTMSEGGTIVDHQGSRLIRNPLREYEASNVTFIQTDIRELDLPPARVIRCMNVLLYVNAREREKLLAVMGRMLDDNGMLIAGFNHFLGGGARYAVYHKTGTRLIPKEFAFSLDNLRPVGIAPWYTLHADDPEAGLLADLTRAIRSDQTFWMNFSRRVDLLLADHGICRRDDNGFLHFSEPPAPPEQLVVQLVAMWRQIDNEDFSTAATEALTRAGFRSWINPVGDIAVRPPGHPFPTVDCPPRPR